MNPIDAIAITQAGLAPSLPTQSSPRPVSSEQAGQFRELLRGDAPTLDKAPRIDLDIEKVMLANLPAATATPAEFAVGMLRAQVKVAQAAVAIELVNKTTQSLSQGVQSLATRS